MLAHWSRIPDGPLSEVQAAALPMVIETAARYLACSGVRARQTLLVNGAGTMVGFVAVQMALRLQGVKVVAMAGETFAEVLREMEGVVGVVGYGGGLVERVRDLLEARMGDAVLDAAPVAVGLQGASALPELVEITEGEVKR